MRSCLIISIAALLLTSCATTSEQAASGGTAAADEMAAEAESAAAVEETGPYGELDGRMVGERFSFPIPDGYQPVPEPLASQLREARGAAVMARAVIEAEDPFRASLVVNVAQKSEPTWLTEEGCAGLAEQIATISKTKVASSRLGPAAGEPSCRIEVSAAEHGGHRRARFAVVRGPDRDWTIVCNFDDRDAAASPACEQVVAGFTAR